MKKNLIIGVLISVCIAIIIWSFSSGNANTEAHAETIDSIQAVLKIEKQKVSTYKKEVIEVNQSQAEHISRADSLQSLLDNPLIDHTCPEKVVILTEQVVELRSGLKKCNQAKVIYVKTIGVQTNIINNVEIITDIRVIQIQECEKEIKKRKLKQWIERVGWVGIIVLIVAI